MEIDPALFIDIISIPIKISSILYKEAYGYAQQIVSTLAVIINENKGRPDAGNESNSMADEILKYKNLLDVGAITQEEYDEKKRQLLES